MAICAVALCWYGSALYQRLTSPWILTHNIPGYAYGAHDDVFSPDAGQVAIAYRDRCKVVDLASGKVLPRLETYPGQGVSDFSSDGKIVSRFPDAKGGDQKAYLWKASNGRILGTIDALENENLEMCSPIFSPDGKKIVVAFARGLVIWDALNLQRLGQVEVAWPEDVWLRRRLAWNPANQDLTAVDHEGQLLKIDLSQNTAIQLLVEQPEPVRFVEWSPDGTRLVTIDRDEGSAAVWDVPAGTVVASIPEQDVLYAYFSPDGKEVVTERKRNDVVRTGRWAPPSWDCSTKIWDATTGELVRDLPTIGGISFSPDWTFRVETGPEGLRIARADGSESCEFPDWFDGHGSSEVFAQDNRHLASVNACGRVGIWRHRDPARLGIDCLTRYEFWISVLAVIGLAWTLWGFRI